MKEQWERIERQLMALGCLDQIQLRPGTSSTRIADLEGHLGVSLPASLSAFLSIHDGQDQHARVGLAGGESLLSVDQIRREWDLWRSLDEEAMNADCAEFMRSNPEGTIKPMYANPSWIPLTTDWSGNHIGLDFDPDVHGTPGQVIRFGRDQDTKLLVADDFDRFIERLVASLAESKWNGQYLESDF